MSHVLQDPSAKLNYSFDWVEWLADGDTITSHQWSITPTGPTLTGDTTDTVFVEDLQWGQIYYLVDHVATQAGVEDERTIVIRCLDT